jgi:hypothetical protein
MVLHESKPEYNHLIGQMNNVRRFFRKCVAFHNCGKIRAHWVDNDNMVHLTSKYKTNSRFHVVSPKLLHLPPSWAAPAATVRTALDAMPKWIKTFYDDYKIYDDVFQARFQTDEDLLKLLDENTIILKEIDKAADIQTLHRETPIFNREFARTILYSIIKSWKFSFKDSIWFAARTVIDIYTVARMIKSQMKNVIIYEGAFHSKNVVTILTALGYNINNVEEPTEVPPLENPIPVPDIQETGPVPVPDIQETGPGFYKADIQETGPGFYKADIQETGPGFYKSDDLEDDLSLQLTSLGLDDNPELYDEL